MLYRLPAGRFDGPKFLRRAFAASALHDLGRRLAEWQRRRNAVWRLNNLDDRLLADIGVGRHEIAARVRGGR